MTIGFIGLGSQGGPMARKLVDSGHDVMLWARRPESLDPYRDGSARYAESVVALGTACEIVCICVVDDAGVAAVADELLPVMQPGGILVIHATIHPESCIALGEQAKTRGLWVVDAPVSGGGDGATKGTLTVMVGGESAPVERVKPLFDSYSKDGGLIVHLGDVGAGQNAKLINNTLMAANMANAHNALAVADALGIDRAVLAQLVRASSGRSFGFDVRARVAEVGAFAHGAKMLAKDVRLLGEVMGDNASAMALGATANPYLDAVAQAAAAQAD
jgi:3-hydroxyisobutyrate dehydrogenase-like beta-hydroxyacid dehydrogenase